MATDTPTILATSGGYRPGHRIRFEFADLLHYAVELSGVSSAVPRVCHIGTASGDNRPFQQDMSEAAREAGFDLTHLSLFPMPNLGDIEEHLMAQDVVWVNGGSVANLLIRPVASRLTASVSMSLAASSCSKIFSASATVTRFRVRRLGRMPPSISPKSPP